MFHLCNNKKGRGQEFEGTWRELDGRDKRENDVNTIVIMKFSKFLNKQINTEKNKQKLIDVEQFRGHGIL